MTTRRGFVKQLAAGSLIASELDRNYFFFFSNGQKPKEPVRASGIILDQAFYGWQPVYEGMEITLVGGAKARVVERTNDGKLVIRWLD